MPAARKANGGKGSIAEQLVDKRSTCCSAGGPLQPVHQNVDAGGTLLARSTGTLGYRRGHEQAGPGGLTSLDAGPVLGLSRPAT